MVGDGPNLKNASHSLSDLSVSPEGGPGGVGHTDLVCCPQMEHLLR